MNEICYFCKKEVNSAEYTYGGNSICKKCFDKEYDEQFGNIE